MTPRLFFFSVAACLAALLISACGKDAAKRYPDYRYRVTVEVNTPEGVKTGSSVIEVKVKRSSAYSLPTPQQLSSRIRGEAVTIDLGKRGTIFALLRSEDSVDWAHGALMLIVPIPTAKSVAKTIEREKKDPRFDMRMQSLYKLQGRYELPRHYYNALHNPKQSDPPTAYPMLVTFKDVRNPASVAKLNADNLAEAFGAGVELRRITVEKTEDAVTTGLEMRLPWLSALRGSIVKYPNLTPIRDIPLEHRLHDGDFTQGVLQ